MTSHRGALPDILRDSPTRIIFGAGAIDQLGPLTRKEGASRVLLVTDPGIVAAGHVQRAVGLLRQAGMEVIVFDGVRENPTTAHVEGGVTVGRTERIDVLVALGGGSAMDCAKGINLILTNGGSISNYRGEDKATQPMLPLIAVPTTAGTGSEAQSFALISDPVTHVKMACGDRRLPAEGGLRPKSAILDPDLTLTQPPMVAAASGIDALAHAVETAGSSKRTPTSRKFSLQAWQLLNAAYPTAVRNPADDDARARMLLGAHLAGAAIERSMLGAAHACANPLTARCGLVHGLAVGLMLPHAIRFNAAEGDNPYADLCDHADQLAARIESLLEAAGLPRRLVDCGVSDDQLPQLASMAAEQWTARFNPLQVGVTELLEIYRRAFS